MHLIPTAVSFDMYEVLFVREAHKRLSAQGFIGICSCRHSVPSMYQNPNQKDSRYSA